MGKRLQKGVDMVRLTLNIERMTYEKLLRLKIAEGDDSGFTKWLNKKLAGVINSNEVLIKGYEVDNSDFD